MTLVDYLAITILALGIMNSIFLINHSRKREIALLHALGLSTFQIFSITFFETSIFATGAIALGDVIGISSCAILQRIGIDLSQWTSHNPHFLGSSMIYPRLYPGNILFISLLAMIASNLAAIPPALKLSHEKPLRILRDL